VRRERVYNAQALVRARVRTLDRDYMHERLRVTQAVAAGLGRMRAAVRARAAAAAEVAEAEAQMAAAEAQMEAATEEVARFAYGAGDGGVTAERVHTEAAAAVARFV
jgi:hypothetical protein